MATNLAIDPALLEQAVQISGARSKREAVVMALEEFIAIRRQSQLVDHFGTLEWDDTYDYKEERRRRDRKLGLAD